MNYVKYMEISHSPTPRTSKINQEDFSLVASLPIKLIWYCTDKILSYPMDFLLYLMTSNHFHHILKPIISEMIQFNVYDYR